MSNGNHLPLLLFTFFLSQFLSFFPSTHLSSFLSIYLSIYLSIFIYFYLSIYLSILSLYLPIYLYFFLSLYISFIPSVGGTRSSRRRAISSYPGEGEGRERSNTTQVRAFYTALTYIQSGSIGTYNIQCHVSAFYRGVLDQIRSGQVRLDEHYASLGGREAY